MIDYSSNREKLLRKLNRLSKKGIEVNIERPLTEKQLVSKGYVKEQIELESDRLEELLQMLDSMPGYMPSINMVSSVKSLEYFVKTGVIPEGEIYNKPNVSSSAFDNIILSNFRKEIAHYNDRIYSKITDVVNRAIEKKGISNVAKALQQMPEKFHMKLIRYRYDSWQAIQSWSSDFLSFLFAGEELKEMQEEFDLEEEFFNYD